MPHQSKKFHAFQADKAFVILSLDQSSHTVAAKGDWVVWDEHLTAVVMTDEVYQRIKRVLQVQPHTTEVK